MASKNGHLKLDLTELVEPIEVTIGKYTGTITGDMALTSMAKMARAFSKIGDVVDGTLSLKDLGVSEGEMWELVEEVMSHATPPPPQGAREMLTTQAAIKLLTFLAARTNEGLETTSSKK